MGKSLQDALIEKSLRPFSDMAKMAERNKTKSGQNNSRLARKVPTNSFENLRAITKVTEFKEVAKNLLLEFPDFENAKEVARIAEGIKNLDGGKKLIWLLLTLRDKIETIKPEFKENFIKRALRSSSPTVEIKNEWRK